MDAITRGVGNGVTVSSDGNRMNFSGATTGDFSQLQARGIVTSLNTTGNVGASAIKIPFLVADSAEDIAARVAIAIRSASVNGVPSANAVGPQVFITGGTVVTTNGVTSALPVMGAPGGKVTGAAVLNGVMFAVSENGGLYRVNTNLDSPTGFTGNIGSYVSTSHDLLGIQFAGLTVAPSNVLNGALSNMLIGIDTQGTLYAFNSAGQLQNIFKGGSSSVQIVQGNGNRVTNVTGLAFSTLDRNLWQPTGNRGLDQGHGLPATPDGSRPAFNGATSLYFGAPSSGDYNFLGGAAGAIESQPIDLSGVSAGALPTLYFNYFLNTENAPNAPTFTMRDSLRVYISGEDGQWSLAATNNSNVNQELASGTDVQELFDNTNVWRQARVPLDAFAGQSNVRLRIEFSSAGSFGFGITGGKGPQLRMKSGDRLIDGQTVTVGSKTLEIKTGPVVSLPAGKGLTPGDSVTIEGVTYVFTDGSVPVASPNIAVSYTTGMSAAQIAGLLLTAVQTAPTVKTNQTITETESNDTLTTSLRGPVGGDSTVARLAGVIGNNPVLTGARVDQDVDLVRVELARGSTLVANANAVLNSQFDSYLRLFDSDGNEVAANDNDPTASTTNSRIRFVAPADGVYYLGVSGAGNAGYRPNVFGTANSGSTGTYELLIDITRQLSAVAKGERLQLEGAANVSTASSSILVSGSSTSTGTNVPVYVNLNMTAEQVGQAFQNALVRAFASGTNLAFTLRGDTLDLTGFTNAQVTPGPFGITRSLSGDAFGAYNFGTLRGANNTFEGAYLDDFIIGLAGRGEMALNVPQDTTFVQRNTFVDPNKIVQGPYQLEIRGGTEYATPLRNNFLPSLQLVSASSPLSRSADGVSLQFKMQRVWWPARRSQSVTEPVA